MNNFTDPAKSTSLPTPESHHTQSTKSISDLPNEMLVEIYKHLNPNDQRNFKMVNKTFYEIRDQLNIHWKIPHTTSKKN